MFDYVPANLDDVRQPEAAYCIATASERFNLPPESLLSLALVEGGKSGTVSANKNGSYDLGMMQVNTVWLNANSPLRDYVSFEKLRSDLCTNVHAAAWILASHLTRTGGDIWRAIGMYHHPSDYSRAINYKHKVNRALPLARQIISQVPDYGRYIREVFAGRVTTSAAPANHRYAFPAPQSRIQAVEQ